MFAFLAWVYSMCSIPNNDPILPPDVKTKSRDFNYVEYAKATVESLSVI